MSAQGSIASSHNDPAQHYAPAGAHFSGAADDPFSSTHDIDTRADGGPRQSDQLVSLTSMGVRAQGPGPLSPCLIAGQNRIRGGIRLRHVPGSGLLECLPKWLNIEYNGTLGTFGPTTQQPKYDAIVHGPTRRPAHISEHAITVGTQKPGVPRLMPASAECLLPIALLGYPAMVASAARALWPIDARTTLNHCIIEDFYDLGTEVSQLPIRCEAERGIADLGVPDTPEEVAENVWLQEHSRTAELSLQLFPRQVGLIFFAPFRPAWSWFTRRLGLTGSWLTCLGMANIKKMQRTLRYTASTPTQHERNLHKHLIANETWRAFIVRFFNENILCLGRYGASGELLRWHQRVYARYWVGVRSLEHYSPHNIPMLQGGEKLSYRDTSSNYVRAQLGLDLRPKTGRLRRNFPFNLFCAADRTYAKIHDTSVDYNAVETKNGRMVNARTSCTQTSTWENSAFAQALDRQVKAQAIKQTGTTQTITAVSVYPADVRRGTKQRLPNPSLLAVPRNYRDAIGLPKHLLGKNITRDMAVEALRILRLNAARSDKDTLERDDQKLEFDTFQTLPQIIQNATAALSTQAGSRIYEQRMTVQQGQSICAEHTGNGYKSTLNVYVRATDLNTQANLYNDIVEVRACVQQNAQGQEHIRSANITLDLAYKPQHSESEFNQKLASFGSLFRDQRTFMPLPVKEEVMRKIGHPAVSRDVKLTATLNSDQLAALKKSCLSDNAATLQCAERWGIPAVEIATLISNGLVQDPLNKQTALALGYFICRRPQPQQALKFLGEICGGTWFDVAPGSGTAAASRLAKEARDLCNTLTLPKPPNAEPWTTLTLRLAPIEAMLRRVRQLKNEPRDPYTHDKQFEAMTAVLNRTEKQLLDASATCQEGMGTSVQAKMTEHLLRTGICNQEDVLAGCHVNHHVFLAREVALLRNAKMRLLTEDQKAQLELKLATMERDLRAMQRGGSNCSHDAEAAAQAA